MSSDFRKLLDIFLYNLLYNFSLSFIFSLFLELLLFICETPGFIFHLLFLFFPILHLSFQLPVPLLQFLFHYLFSLISQGLSCIWVQTGYRHDSFSKFPEDINHRVVFQLLLVWRLFFSVFFALCIVRFLFLFFNLYC